MTTSQLADALVAHPFFTNQIMAGRITSEEQAAVLLDNFGLKADGIPDSAGSQAQAYFTSLINSGVGFGQIVYQAVKYLSESPAVEFRETARLLDEKAIVAGDYSREHSSDDLSELQHVLYGVIICDPAACDPVDNNFTLTNSLDNVSGTSRSDTIIGDNVSINSFDTIDGGGGIDIFKVFELFDAATSPLPVITNVETIYFLKLANADQNFSALAQATTGINRIEIGDASLLDGKTITTTSDRHCSQSDTQ